MDKANGTNGAGWEEVVRISTPSALRTLGVHSRRAAEGASRRAGIAPPPRLMEVVDALDTGDADKVVRAMRKVSPELRSPILYWLKVLGGGS